MSPASQGNLEVERYIGSCLISARLNNNSSKNVSNNHPAGYKNKKVANGDGGINGRSGGRLQSRPLLGCPPGPMVSASCDCTRYGSPGRHTPAGWAGMPLISMAVNARRHRKPPPPNHGPPRGAKTGPADSDAFLRTPLSRLAIHTQGAPLILAGHYGGRKNGAGHRGPNKQGKGDAQNGRKFNGDASANRETRTAGNNNNNGSTPSSDCLSVASDESSGHSENSLPRIIKPRKRRKKDRKPPASPPSEANSADTDPATESSTIVTLKPYVPLCHDLYDGHRGGAHRRDAKVWERQRSCPEELERTSPTSEKDSKPREEAEDGDALLNTLFPFRCAPSVCQCRYCDPSGLIWDVDQHCYSPFLTPPSLDLPFVNLPLFLSPPPEVKSLDLFNKDFENSSSPVVDADHKEPVRRSWSEPSASFSAREDAAVPVFSASLEFGVIGGGRKEARHSSTSSSEGLEVSTEIVTSLNGHRDIEIKFYSSSPPSAVVDAMSEDRVDRWGVWEPEGLNGGECAWNRAWETPRNQTPDSVYESNSKQLSDEVNQLCLHNVEE